MWPGESCDKTRYNKTIHRLCFSQSQYAQEYTINVYQNFYSRYHARHPGSLI